MLTETRPSPSSIKDLLEKLGFGYLVRFMRDHEALKMAKKVCRDPGMVSLQKKTGDEVAQLYEKEAHKVKILYVGPENTAFAHAVATMKKRSWNFTAINSRTHDEVYLVAKVLIINHRFLNSEEMQTWLSRIQYEVVIKTSTASSAEIVEAAMAGVRKYLHSKVSDDREKPE